LQVPPPKDEKLWPEGADKSKILCFLTDGVARATYALPPLPAGQKVTDMLASYAWGTDALKLQSMTLPERQRFIAECYASGLQPGGGGGQAVTLGVASAFAAAKRPKEVVWNQQPFVNGGFKLDKPEDNYFAASLFYHYQLAGKEAGLGPADVFFSGDTVGHLGGWIEGAAMSAVNAATAVCARIAATEPGMLTVRGQFAQLLKGGIVRFHQYQTMDGSVPRRSGTNAMMRVGNWDNDPALPATWQDLGVTDPRDYSHLSVSANGDFMVGVEPQNSLVYFNLTGPDGQWRVPQRLEQLGGVTSTSLSVATEKGATQPAAAQLMVVDQGRGVWHGMWTEKDGWTAFRQPDWGAGITAVALDVEAGNAQVGMLDGQSNLAHAVRLTNGTWSGLVYPPGLRGPGSRFGATGVAVGCTPLTLDLTTVAAIDNVNGWVYVCIRDGRRLTWTNWTLLPSPKDSSGRIRSALRVRVLVLGGANDAQVLALFDDGRLYSSVRNLKANPTGAAWTKFRPVPYPFSGLAGTIADFAPCLTRDPEVPPLSTIAYAQLRGDGVAEVAPNPLPTREPFPS
jgi:hypothetical protein